MDFIATTPLLLESFAYASSGNFFIQILINAAALLIAGFFLDGIQIKGMTTAALVALAIAFLNATIGQYLTEITGFYRGILHFIVDAVVILIASALFDGFKVKGFLWAFILAIALTFINTFLYRVFAGL